MEKDERIDMDDIITAVSMARAHAKTMLFYLFPYFDKADANAEIMSKIKWEYGHIRTLLEVIQNCLCLIEQQENAWEKRAAQAAE